jgi:HTH-type transcriptional regulator, glycine betaine synthesis regulator
MNDGAARMTDVHETKLSSDPRLAAVHDSMLDGLGQLADYFGFSKVTGQVFGALLLSPRPLCLDDMVELLDISKANASMTMRALGNLGMVREVWVRGASGRRKYYEAESNFWRIITNVLKSREMRDVERALHVMDDNARKLNHAMDELTEEERQLAGLYLERIAHMQGLFQFAQVMIEAILDQVHESPDEMPALPNWD